MSFTHANVILSASPKQAGKSIRFTCLFITYSYEVFHLHYISSCSGFFELFELCMEIACDGAVRVCI